MADAQHWAQYPKGAILALDLAMVTGYAIGRLQDRLPATGTIRLPKLGGEGARYASFENEAAAIFDIARPSRVIMASPLALPAMNNRLAAFQQITLRGTIRAEAWRSSVSVTEVSEDSVRTEIIGRCRWPKDETKPAIVGWCKKRGVHVQHHDEADAAVLWFWLQGRLRQGEAMPHEEIVASWA